MPQQRTIAQINPKVLEWIIDSSGWEISELAEKLKVDPKTIQNWKLKKQGIELGILEKLADYVKRPLAIFFLPSPPSESEIKDFRKISSTGHSKLSKETLLSIREARYLQSVANELLVSQNIPLEPKIKQATIKDNPEKIANRERAHLGFDSTEGLLSPKARRSINNHYNKLREILESLNIFVFQSKMSVEEVRGLSLPDKLPRSIVINSNDSYQARIFSLMHEYAHVLLNEDGICIPEYDSNEKPMTKQYQIESWCNRFAGAILVPTEIFLDLFTKMNKKEDAPQSIIDALSNKFRVSKQVIIVQILRSFPNHPKKQYFLNVLNELQKQSKSVKKQSGGFASPVTMCISKKGRKYVSLVLDSHQKNIINSSNIIDYLDLKLKHLEEIKKCL